MKILDIISLANRDPIIGSKVRMTNPEYEWTTNKIGTIVSIRRNSNFPYTIQFNLGIHSVFDAYIARRDEFEVIQ